MKMAAAISAMPMMFLVFSFRKAGRFDKNCASSFVFNSWRCSESIINLIIIVVSVYVFRASTDENEIIMAPGIMLHYRMFSFNLQ